MCLYIRTGAWRAPVPAADGSRPAHNTALRFERRPICPPAARRAWCKRDDNRRQLTLVGHCLQTCEPTWPQQHCLSATPAVERASRIQPGRTHPHSLIYRIGTPLARSQAIATKNRRILGFPKPHGEALPARWQRSRVPATAPLPSAPHTSAVIARSAQAPHRRTRASAARSAVRRICRIRYRPF
jgi:hypothetical protein